LEDGSIETIPVGDREMTEFSDSERIVGDQEVKQTLLSPAPLVRKIAFVKPVGADVKIGSEMGCTTVNFWFARDSLGAAAKCPIR